MSQKGDWLTQIKQIDRIIGTYLRNQREIIPVTRCERTLTETAESAEVGDRLTQIHWIYKIFLRKSAISARDYLYKEQSLPTHNRASGCNFYNLALTTNVVQSATWG